MVATVSIAEQSLALVEELHHRQSVMYAGGRVQPVLELLSPTVVWHVPGSSAIPGEHHGHDALTTYFERRRRIATETMRMHPGQALTAPDLVVQLVDGTATLGGEQAWWSTVGVYQLDANHVAEVWLVPTDLAQFDRVWSSQV